MRAGSSGSDTTGREIRVGISVVSQQALLVGIPYWTLRSRLLTVWRPVLAYFWAEDLRRPYSEVFSLGTAPVLIRGVDPSERRLCQSISFRANR